MKAAWAVGRVVALGAKTFFLMVLEGVRRGGVCWLYLNIQICTLIRFLETFSSEAALNYFCSVSFPVLTTSPKNGCAQELGILVLPGGSIREHRNIQIPGISPLRTRGSGTHIPGKSGEKGKISQV